MTGPRAPEPTREILNIEEAAQLLGVSTKTFAKVLRDGEIPGRKIGREWKFSKQALITWVANGKSCDFLDLQDETDGEDEGAVEESRDARFLARDPSKIAGREPSSPTNPLTRPRQNPPPRRGENEMSVEED